MPIAAHATIFQLQECKGTGGSRVYQGKMPHQQSISPAGHVEVPLEEMGRLDKTTGAVAKKAAKNADSEFLKIEPRP
jgi:hypothetical protein